MSLKRMVTVRLDDEMRAALVALAKRMSRPGLELTRADVAEAGEQKLDLVQDFIDVVTSMCARIYGRRAASNRAKKALAAAQEEP